MSHSNTRVLVVARQFLEARLISNALQERGWEIAGPFPTVADALGVADFRQLHAAVLDLPDRPENVLLVDRLVELSVAIVLIESSLPGRPGNVGRALPYLRLPWSANDVVEAVAAALETGAA